MTFLTVKFSSLMVVRVVVVVVLGTTAVFPQQDTIVDGFVIPNVTPTQQTLRLNHAVNQIRWNRISTSHTSSGYPTINHPMALRAIDLTGMGASITTTSIATSTTNNMDPLLTYLLQTLITNGVPALFSIIVFGFIAWQIRSVMTNSQNSRNNNNNSNNVSSLSLLYDDLYGDQDQDPFKRNNPSSFGMFGGGGNRQRFPMELPKNTGVPKLQYIKVTHLNPKYDSYKYSMTAQTQSKAIAAAQYRQSAWQRAWGKALLASGDSQESTALTPFQIQSLIQLEQEFLKSAKEKQQEIQSVITALQRKNIDESMKKMGMESVYQMDPNVPTTDSNVTTTTTTKMTPSGGSLRKWKGNRDTNVPSTASLSVLQTDLVNLEMKFINNVIKTVGPSYAATIRTIILGSENGEGLTQLLLSSNLERPLTRLLAGHWNGDDFVDTTGGVGGGGGVTQPTKKIYVTRFPGDLNASQVATLREEITAILQSKPRPNIDEVILVLQTGGGTVTGYGLAAAQLQRIKNANIHLTIAVEQVAASGGYMMACIADTIVASPFAVLGSIGVISDIPNVYERLKQEGIEFQTITAGKYKRTITPTKKVTKEDYQKSKEDIEEVFGLFRDFVKENRPKLDIDKVATGETWFGTAALELKLCDAIQTVDDLLLNKINNGDEVYEVTYKPPSALNDSVLGRLLQPASTVSNDGPIRSAVRWMVQTVAREVHAEILSSSGKLDPLRQPVENRYLAVDETSERVRSQIE